jgi:hypothetical protein
MKKPREEASDLMGVLNYYQGLLIRYMAHVGHQEGTYFLGKSLEKTELFSTYEKAELGVLSMEAESYDN